ncbi:MAG: DUF3618 domain-containing protein [Thermoleophilia bacterium]|nr:DUF3618 domain-containing protein [Thermoleophilia bacterium]
MSDDPEVIRQQIAHTRDSLSRHVNALGESVAPGNVARRQVSKVGDKLSGAKEMIMGASEHTQETASSAREGASSALSSAGDAVQGAPAQARQRTQGNPLAAGLVALGAGLLLGSLVPSSKRERDAALAAKDRAEPLKDEAQRIAKDAGEHLREPAMGAVESVKTHAQQAAETVKAEGQTAADDVRAGAQDAADTVRDSRS